MDFWHNRPTSRFSVGEYWLIPESNSPFYRALGKTNKALPPSLRGRWSGMEAFRKACEKHHGSDSGYDNRSLNRKGELVPEEMDKATAVEMQAAFADAPVT